MHLLKIVSNTTTRARQNKVPLVLIAEEPAHTIGCQCKANANTNHTTTNINNNHKHQLAYSTSKWMATPICILAVWLLIILYIFISTHLLMINGQVLSFPRLLGLHHHQTTLSTRSHNQQQQQQQRQQRQTTSSQQQQQTTPLNNSSSATTTSGWHFPRLSQEQADVILTGVQVIGKIAQAETSLNFCRTPDGQEGECSDIRKCFWLMLDRSRLRQSVCLRNLIIPAVCCPNNVTETIQTNGQDNTLPLLKAKAPRKRKPLDHHQLRPLNMTSTQQQLVSGPPTGMSSLIIRNHNQQSSSTTTSTTTTTTTTTAAPRPADSGNPLESAHHSILAVASSGNLHLMGPDSIANNQTSLTTTIPSSGSAINQSITYPWSNSSTSCGEGGRLRTGRIVGGSDSKQGQWPWMSAIYLSKNHGAEFWCGGALINNKYILTAAHCLSDQRGNKYLTEQITVKLGGVDLVKHQAPAPNRQQHHHNQHHQHHNGDLHTAQQQNSPLYSDEGSILDSNNHNELSITQILSKALLGSAAKALFQQVTSSVGGPQRSSSFHSQAGSSATATKEAQQPYYFNEYKASAVKQHPKFQRHGFYNDIGLIELAEEVQFDEHIQPICLPSHSDMQRDFTGYMATVLGWGTLSYGGPSSKSLQQVTMPIWTNKDCDDRYLQPIGKTFLCAGFLQGGKDACQGDSGGPLMISDATGRWTLHGIVSFGKTCAQAGYPGVYTKVTEYLGWIKDNIQ